MIQPIRIQRKRTRGWKMPENTVSVTRPGHFGNPFKVGHRYKWGGLGRSGIDTLMIYMESYVEDKRFTTIESNQQAIEWYEIYLEKYPELVEKIKMELKGKNLACFCSLENDCHADILLKIANQYKK